MLDPTKNSSEGSTGQAREGQGERNDLNISQISDKRRTDDIVAEKTLKNCKGVSKRTQTIIKIISNYLYIDGPKLWKFFHTT